MPTTERFIHFQTVLGSVVDYEDMIVRGVSVITEGVARGHNMMVDRETLDQIKGLANEFDGGLKVKMNHFSGFDAIVGSLKNFRIKGKKLLADLHLIKTHEAAPRILEMADSMPDTFGLSVSFSGVPEEKDGFNWARATELYSADLVDEPAANPDGLFSSKVENPAISEDTNKNRNMSATQTPQPDNSASELESKLSALTAVVEKLAAAIPQPERKIDDNTSLSEVTVIELKNLIQSTVAEQTTALGWKPGKTPASAPSDGQTNLEAGDNKPEEPKTFPDIIKGLVEGGMTKAEAVTFAIKKPENVEAFEAWKASGGSAHFNF